MKIALPILIVIVVAVLATGCTTTAPVITQVTTSPTVSQSRVIPNMTGTWTGSMQGYEQSAGFTNYRNEPMTMIISAQQGRIFSGHYVWKTNGTVTTEGFAGVIGPDGKTLSTAEENGGYSSGILTSAKDLDLTWHYAGSQYGVAIDSLKKV